MKNYEVQGFIYLKLFSVFLLASVTLLALQNPAVITQLEVMKTKQKTSDPSAPDVRKTALLEIWEKDGNPHYKFQPPSGQASETSDATAMLGTIKQANPVELIIRADRHVTVGDMDAVILPARESGIQVWRSNDKK